MKRIVQLFLILILFPAANLLCQPKDNLSIFYNLIDESVSKIDSSVNETKENLAVNLSLPQPLELLRSKLIIAFKQNGYVVKENDGSSTLNYSLTDANVTYQNPYKDGLFGSVLAERIIKLNGSYFLTANSEIKEPSFFNLTHADTVAIDSIPALENRSLPFTRGEVPQPPLLSNLLEPAIVIGALITTIILFFTVRSK